MSAIFVDDGIGARFELEANNLPANVSTFVVEKIRAYAINL